MSRQRFIWLLVAAVLAISGAMYLSAQRNLPRDNGGQPLLPSLANELNTVTAVSVRRGAATPAVTVHSQGGRWTVAERGDYPADVSKLRKLLLALSEAKIVEQKTSNPASFPVIGVEDPAQTGATGAEISVTAKDGNHAVIVGKPVGEGNFARRAGENTSYIVEPSISVEAEPRNWIESGLLDIATAGIQSIAIKPAAGSAYNIHSAAVVKAAPATPATPVSPATPATPVSPATPATPVSPATPATPVSPAPFALDGVPPGRKAVDAAALAPSPSAFSGVTADDVAPVADVDFSKATVATLTLADGGVVTITGVTSGDKHWIQVQASKDTALNAKAAGRTFEIAGYRFDAMFRPLEQLLVPKEPPKGADKGTAGKSVASKNTVGPAPAPTKKQSPAPKS
jgi:Domain of unknown function (DUF4340)